MSANKTVKDRFIKMLDMFSKTNFPLPLIAVRQNRQCFKNISLNFVLIKYLWKKD